MQFVLAKKEDFKEKEYQALKWVVGWIASKMATAEFT